MEAITELSKMVARIVHLTDHGDYGAIGRANAIPAINRRRVEAVSISARDGHWAREAELAVIEAAKAIRSELAARNEEQGRTERLVALKAIADELESLRAIIPAVAAKVAIEAGTVARSIAELSKGEK